MFVSKLFKLIPCFFCKYSGEYKFISLGFLTFFVLGLDILVTGFLMEGLIFLSIIVSFFKFWEGNCFHLFPHEPHWTVLPDAVIALSGTTNFLPHELQVNIVQR